MKHYWEILRKHQWPARLVTARLLAITGFCRLLTIPQAGFRLRFHPANLPFQLWINPAERDASLAFFRAYLRPGDRVVDVGANVGHTVLTSALLIGPRGHVVAIEAHPRTFGFLQDNLHLNQVKNVTAIHSAVGATAGVVRFSDDRRDDMNRVGSGDLDVTMEPLDKLVADDLPVDLLKVDVEGYEKFVFEGASRLLTRAQCVFFEISARHFARFGYTTRELLDLIGAAGFQIFRISGDTSIAEVTVDYNSEAVEDLVAFRNRNEFLGRTGWNI